MRKKYLGDSGTDIGFPTDPNSETSPDIDPSLFLDLKVLFSLKLNKIIEQNSIDKINVDIICIIPQSSKIPCTTNYLWSNCVLPAYVEDHCAPC